MRFYTERYGSDVVGIVLVDATHESSVLFSLREGRWVRLREQATGRVVPEPRREGRASTRYTPEDDYQAEEFRQMYLWRANPEALGSRPLIVLAAGKRPPPPGTSEDLWLVLMCCPGYAQEKTAEQNYKNTQAAGDSRVRGRVHYQVPGRA